MKMKFSIRDLWWLITLFAAISGWFSHYRVWRHAEQQWLAEKTYLKAALSKSDDRYLAEKSRAGNAEAWAELAKRNSSTLAEEMEEVKKQYRERLEPLQRALNESRIATQALKDENKELRTKVGESEQPDTEGKQ
jgi:hypothetical protein